MVARIRRALRWALCALVLLGLVPGMAELVENLEHVLHDGHLRHGAAHVDDGEQCESDTEEHGCTPFEHHCKCCASIAGIPQGREVVGEPVATAAPAEARTTTVARLVSRDPTPPVRPPIA